LLFIYIDNKMQKYKLTVLNEYGEVINTHYFKSLKHLNLFLPDVEYHQLRTIYQQSKKQSKFLHPHIQRLYDQFRISSKIEDIDLNFLQLINH